jgi:hypothetical protein
LALGTHHGLAWTAFATGNARLALHFLLADMQNPVGFAAFQSFCAVKTPIDKNYYMNILGSDHTRKCTILK